MSKKITALVLCVILCLLSCSCGKVNDGILTVGIGELSGNFSPFCQHTVSEKTVLDTVFTKLWEYGDDGIPVCGDETASAAKSFRMFYADNDFNETEEYVEAEGMTAIEFILKNDIMFSDGSKLTAQDVLFSVYAAIDPAAGYISPEALPLAGMTEYISQLGDVAPYTEVAYEILSKGIGYVPGEEDVFNEEQSSLFWSGALKYGADFAEQIISYVIYNYSSDDAVASYISPDISAEDVLSSTAMKNSYAMRLWNYGTYTYSYAEDATGLYVGAYDGSGGLVYKTTYENALSDDMYSEFVPRDDGEFMLDEASGEFVKAETGDGVRYSRELLDKYTRISRTGVTGFRDAAGTLYSLEGDDFPTAESFFSLMCLCYTSNDVFDYTRMESVEAPGETDLFSSEAVKSFALYYAREENVDSVSGLRSGSFTDESGTEFETVTFYFKGNYYEGIYKTDFYIAPEAYYTEGFEVPEDVVSNYGVPLDSAEFSAHLEARAEAPVGSGPYILSRYEKEEGAVYLTANTFFRSPVNGEAPKTSYIKFLSVSGRAAEALKDGDIMISLVHISPEEVSKRNITSMISAGASYEYVVVNPAFYNNINTRRALMTLMDTGLCTSLEGYGEIETSVPSFMWAAGDIGEKSTLYDGTAQRAKDFFRAAGYYYSESGGLIEPSTNQQAAFELTLPTSKKGSKTDEMFIKAANALTAIGAQASVVYSDSLQTDIYSESGVAIYSLGWEIGVGADLYERYAVSSNSDAVRANGLKALGINAGIDNFGTILFSDDGENEEKLTQSDAVMKLDELIVGERAQLSLENKKMLISKALGLISELSFELPVCERKVLFYIRADLVDFDSLYQTPTSFRSLISEIWNIDLKG